MIGGSPPWPGPVRLRTLGTLELQGIAAPDASAFVSQPKRAALLVYMAVARPRGLHRRDTLLALLWPESDQSRARHALSQLVYQLRRMLGPDALVSRGDDALGIDDERLWCDAAAFESTLAGGRPEEALELYGGEFLAGFHVADAAPELEEWIAGERTRLRDAAVAAARTVAGREERAGNRTGAASWGRRAAALATPDDETAAGELIGLLRRLGDRAGALRAYDAFARRLEKGFGLEPSPELRALAAEMRHPPAARPPVSEGSDTSPPPAFARRRPRPLAWGAGAAAILAATVLSLRATSVDRQPPIVAVGAVSDFTHADTGASAPMVADLLATSVARLSAIQVIAMARLYEVQSQLGASTGSPVSLYDAARQAGARQLVQATLHPSPGGGVQLDLQRISVKSGAVEKAYRAEGPDLFAAVDRATAALARDLGTPVPSEPVASVTTHSLVAYRLYEEGLRAHYQQDLTAALRLFRAALAEDSSFAMAAYWVWVTSGGGVSPASPFLERAVRLADRATDRERLVIREALAEQQMDPRAHAIAETLAVRYPADPDAQIALGRMRMSAGDFLGTVEPLRRVLALDSLSLVGPQARCRACDAYQQLAWAYVWADSLDAAERVLRDWAGQQPTSPLPWLNLTALLELRGPDARALKAQQIADSLTPADVSQEPLRARLALRRGDYLGADERLRRLAVERGWADAEWFLAISLRNQGRLREAMELAIARQQPVHAILLLEQGRLREAAAEFEASAIGDLSAAPPGHVARNRAFNLTNAATALAAAGDTSRLGTLADAVEAIGLKSLYGRDALLHHYIRGLLLTARNQPARAEGEYRQAIFSWNEGYTRVNYALARTLLRLGRPRDAVAVLQPAFRGSLEASNLYITRTELHELLARAFDAAGEPDSAITHYRAVETAWRNADRQFRTRWEAAKRHIDGRR